MQSQQLKQISQRSKQIIESFSVGVSEFYKFHGVQILGSQIPVELVETLYNKLEKGIYDAGEYVQIDENEQAQTFEVRSKQQLKKNSNLFIVDHALTFKYNELRKILKQNPKLIPRLLAMLKYSTQMKQPQKVTCQQQQNKQEQGGQEPQTQSVQNQNIELQLQSMSLTQISHLQLPPNTVTLSLIDNAIPIQHQEQMIKKLQYLNLKALWVNENPIQQSQKLKQYVRKKTKVEIFNSKLTQNCTTWGLKYASKRSLKYAYDPIMEHVYELNLDGREVFCVDFNLFKKFKNLRSLSIKQHSLQPENAKQYILSILKQLPSLRYLYVQPQVEKWLFDLFQSKQISQEIANRVLVNKHSLMLQPAPQSQDYEIDLICANIFKICGCYRLASSQQLDQSSTWYINDEVGSMIPHSDFPNVKLIPFLYAPNSKLDSQVQAFSILWPVKDIAQGQLVFRDYLNGMTQKRQRSSRLAVWYKLPEEHYINCIVQYNKKMFQLEKTSISVLQTFYKQNGQDQKQYYRKISLDDSFFPIKHKVITDHELVNKYLKSGRFQLVEKLEQATIVWLSGAAEQQQWAEYKGKYFINQFPFESCVVMKHNLADTIQSVFGDTKFLQRTYNLQKNLEQFVGDFYQRQNKAEDNLWIIKPPNMARSMDMIISDNLPALIKSMETGPKIAQKYITNPVLRQTRKVDLRYVLLVKSVKPLTLFLYKHFWIRSSNNPYTTDTRAMATYQTQFTVMNYGKVSDFKQIKYKDFIQQFQKDYNPTHWSTIHQKIKKMLRNTFIAVGEKYPQMQDDKSRAVYGIDIMIDADTMQPKLLEITFSPDCKRACEYYPTFYDQIFQALFSDVIGENIQRII